MNGYPVLLKVENRRCVVVGGGQVATRKVTTLLDAGAHICLISPVVDPTLQQLSDVGRIEIRHMAYRPDHLTEIKPFLVIAATDNPDINQQVAADATQMNILVNVVDTPSQSDFTNMATIRRGPIVVGVASGGASAALS
ncbi:MAG: bifunctional precorrin-2 dehydrogenase/sirohydrochlorin ferrochelatase, partial [Anaerolineae bacterium]